MWLWNPTGGPTMCPLKALTGWDCPFCGGLRGTHDLLHGDVAAALNQNVLLPLYLGLIAGGWALWWRTQRQAAGRPGQPGRTARLRRWAPWLLLALLIVFTVVRNLPGVTYLPSGLG